MIYITSDLHFGHHSIIRFCGRPPLTKPQDRSFGPMPDEWVDKMNAYLLNGINSTVRQNDELYVLGDFSYDYRRGTTHKTYLDKIKCKNVHLIRGNHDANDDIEAFKSVSDLKTLKYNKMKFVLCHYPIVSWPGREGGAMHLYGHCHGNLEQRYIRANMLDMSIDNTAMLLAKADKRSITAESDYRPLSIDEVLHFLKCGKEE